MQRILTIFAFTTFAATVAAAQNLEVIKARQGHLEAMGKAAKEPIAMLKGEAPLDLAKVKAALKVYQERAPKLPDLFPDDSKQGEDTEALPEIWKNKKDFVDRYAKLAADAKAAEATIDAATFEDTFTKVMSNCSGCHKVYRKPKT